ncbi:hypothetical protein SteCoe_29680 [Stentor coeruleus]|uniref:Major facilitator superfamily (MFS) profile domain-containing protein n=1 Tax=Stentor coeruleus TaxID=5963 RepID=A0A1R2B5A6_9CILI|nr:hypothetical protein SteCoe_29680 [Stentor coeruleus]
MDQNELFFRSKVWELALHISLSSFIYCFGFSSINPCMDNIGETLGWGGSYLMISIFAVLYPIGALFGALIGTRISSAYGGRFTIIISNVIFIVGSLISIIPSNYTFGAGRFITGIIGGVFITIPAVLINEITPDDMTGQVGTLIQSACNLGFLVAFLFGLIVPLENLDTSPSNYLWMLIIFCPAFFSFYQIIYFLKVFKTEFPSWLIKHNREDEARASLRYVYSESGVDIGMKRLMPVSEENPSTNSSNEALILIATPSYKNIFCSKSYRKILRITIALNMGQQTSGSTPLLLYSNSIFKSMGGGEFIARVFTVILGLILLIFGLLAIPLLKKFGRKTILVLGQALITIDLLLLGFFTGIIDGGVAVNATLMFLYFAFFMPSLGATCWAYMGEVLNEKCISFGLAINLSTVVTVSFLFPILNNFLGMSSCLFIFCGLSFMLFVWEALDLFETKGLTKREILKKALSNNKVV